MASLQLGHICPQLALLAYYLSHSYSKALNTRLGLILRIHYYKTKEKWGPPLVLVFVKQYTYSVGHREKPMHTTPDFSIRMEEAYQSIAPVKENWRNNSFFNCSWWWAYLKPLVVLIIKSNLIDINYTCEISRHFMMELRCRSWNFKIRNNQAWLLFTTAAKLETSPARGLKAGSRSGPWANILTLSLVWRSGLCGTAAIVQLPVSSWKK